MTTKSLAGTVLALLFTAVGSSTARQTPIYDDLGSHSYPITTSDPDAQRYFNQGLRLYYAFNHAEAIRSFDAALGLDPDCAMCTWGIALSHGPNINAPMGPVAGAMAYQYAGDAVSLSKTVSPREQALIHALAERYGEDPTADRKKLDAAYARAMASVLADYPEDLEVATLYAEALMDLSPWDYWQEDGTPRETTATFLPVLSRVLDERPEHPGANHLYIHAVEEVDPYGAVEAAERLAGLMPGAGHIVHMPGHIYVRVGRYADAIRANEHAVHADETYISDQKPEMGVYVAGYYPHNYDFLSFAASMIGREDQAIDAAESVRSVVPAEMVAAPGMEFLQNRVTRHLQMKVRFSRWEDILEEESPADGALHARAIWHYARGRAYVALGNVDAARTELTALQDITTDPWLEGKRLLFNTSATVLTLAEHVLRAHVLIAEGDESAGIDVLRQAASLEDAMTYGEPPEWSIPVRQESGRMLLAADRPQEALQVFNEDLERFPDNAWSLYGRAKALEALGRTDEASDTMTDFYRMWQGSDMPELATR